MALRQRDARPVLARSPATPGDGEEELRKPRLVRADLAARSNRITYACASPSP